MSGTVDAAPVVERLRRNALTMGVAESCTAGMVGARITDVPGSSAVFLGGFIVYNDQLKSDLLGVPGKLFLDGHGAVSASVVEAMAEGLRERIACDLAVAVSGIAGPTGGTDRKPVGTVWLACVGPGDLVNVHRIQAEGSRRDVREQAVDAALTLLGRNLDEAED